MFHANQPRQQLLDGTHETECFGQANNRNVTALLPGLGLHEFKAYVSIISDTGCNRYN